MCVERGVQIEPLLGDGDEHVDRHGDPDLRLHRVLGVAEKPLDPKSLAQHRDVRCKATIETLEEALGGHYQDEHVFEFTQALALYDFYQTQIAQCDVRIESALRVGTSSRH